MAGLNLTQYFLNPIGLYALLALIPFLLIYIVKPKPKKIIMPSLMFFIKDRNKSHLNSFLEKFFSDFLFFLQLIVLLLLAATFAKPYMIAPRISYADTMVFVIDGSASMNAVEDGITRFETAKRVALDRVENKNSIILATHTSEIIAEDLGRQETEDAIRTLNPRETGSSLYDSIVLAENYIDSDNSGVMVISDFTNERLEKEFLRGKAYLQAKGIDVYFEDVSKNTAKNVGIIDVQVNEQDSIIWVKNFNDNPETVNVKYGDKYVGVLIFEGKDVKSIAIPELLNGKSTIEIDAKDDFKVDNFAYISTPMESGINVMLISNQEEKYLATTLELMNKINMHWNKPPVVKFDNPDIIIIGDVKKNVIIPGDIEKVKKLVSEQGVPLIILAQDDILNIGLGDVFPLELIKSSPITDDDTIIPYNPDSFLTPAEIQFGIAKKFYETKQNENVITYAKTSKNGYPIITLSTYGKGKVLFYGIFDEYSEFKSDIFYPVFWKRSIDLLIGGKTLAETNKKTGYMKENSKNKIIQTPKGVAEGKMISLDYTGFYDFDDHTVAVNLIAEEEQRLNKDKITSEESKLPELSKEGVDDTKEQDLSELLLIIIGGLLLFEFLYLKFRGDV